MLGGKILTYIRRYHHSPPNFKEQKNPDYLNRMRLHGKYIAETIPKHIEAVLLNEQTKEMELIIPNTSVLPVLRFLKSHVYTQYIQLVDITAIDVPKRVFRFEVIYNLLSLYYNARIRVKTSVDELTPLDSATGLFLSANWPEREVVKMRVFDMFGVYFKNHPDMRRILTDYGFEGHPLRKDFPLSGYYELRYDPEEFTIAERPIQFPQEYRKFELDSPWDPFTESKNDKS